MRSQISDHLQKQIVALWFACTREIGSLVHVTLPVAAWICVAGAGNGTLNCDIVWQAQHQCDIWWQAQSIEASW